MKVIKNVTEHTGRFAVIIVGLVSILLPTYGKNIGEGCNVDNTSEQGICKHVRNCSVVYQQLLADKLPESICGYSGIDPIVCCPTPIPQTTEIKCAVAAEAVYGLVLPLIPVLDPRPVNVSHCALNARKPW